MLTYVIFSKLRELGTKSLLLCITLVGYTSLSCIEQYTLRDNADHKMRCDLNCEDFNGSMRHEFACFWV